MLVKLEQVKKQYGDFALNVSVKVEKGKVIGLIGANGAGKSTTFKILTGLVQKEEGLCEVFGKPIEALSIAEKAQIGVVLSDSGFSGYLDVKDVITVMDAMYPSFSKDTFLKKCQQFKLPVNKKIKEFSTGMKAKLKVLLALSYDTKLLILDEPTAGLDVMTREELLDLLREYMESGEKSIIISSHISTDLENFCDEIYMIDEGKIVMQEDADVLLSEYGILKVTEEQYEKLDKRDVLRIRKENFGYVCLTNQKQYYMENYPEISVEKSSIDEIILLMVRGEKVA